MAVRFILTGYVDQLMNEAVYDKLEDGSFAGRIPLCKGVIAFGNTLRECEDELHSTLEDWILVGLKMGHHLPVKCRVLCSTIENDAIGSCRDNGKGNIIG